MALTTDDIWNLEFKVRRHADDLRKEVAAYPGTTPAFKAADAAKLAEAKAYDAIGDLLMGLQGDWAQFGPLVREGYKLEAKRRAAPKIAPKVETEAEGEAA